MFDHVSIGVADIARARRFYDNALKPLGFSLLSDGETSLGYGKDAVGLWILQSNRPVAPDGQSGLHFCFAAPDAKSVSAFHKAGLSAGGTDNGKPGLRTDYGPDYYAAYVVDPDGYRLEAYCADSKRWTTASEDLCKIVRPAVPDMPGRRSGPLRTASGPDIRHSVVAAVAGVALRLAL